MMDDFYVEKFIGSDQINIQNEYTEGALDINSDRDFDTAWDKEQIIEFYMRDPEDVEDDEDDIPNELQLPSKKRRTTS